jgi:antitoxin (DNA-binding transcriptional repressor) of toxin-antitoxin stability system
MKTLTIEELQADFDAIISRVEGGESFLIKSEHGDAMLIPYGEYKEVDDLIRIHTDHEEGC